jgi:diacylglycerol kinase family enzyme
LLSSIAKQILFGNLQSQESVLSSKKNILYYQARKITIENLSSALLHIDGEPAPLQTSVRAEVIPNAFKLIQP